MKFAPLPPEQAIGTILAHSVDCGGKRLRKGTCLGANDVAALEAGGFDTITVACLDQDDHSENTAAARIGDCLTSAGLRQTDASTGRVNLVADTAGVLTVDTHRIHAMNQIDEGVTLATLANFARVDEHQLAATIKIIPYGVATQNVDAAIAALGDSALQLHPFKGGRAHLVLTRTSGFKDSLIEKGRARIETRIRSLGYRLCATKIVDHTSDAIADALNNDADLILILGASATSDRADVAPSAVVKAGGSIERFGMPVDPGNLLFLGSLNGTPVVGLPGCARSPALNGVDWVLERLAAGLAIDSDSIAAMGVGGLLKEMPGRPHPRQSKA